MRIELTQHACDRYRDRVKMGLGDEQARDELLALVDLASPPVPACPWQAHEAEKADAYLVLADGIALALRRGKRSWIAVTCLTRSSHSEELRARRNEKARAKRARRKARRRDQRGRIDELRAEARG